MRKILLVASVIALALTSAPAAWSADPVAGAGSYSSHSRKQPQHSKASKPWQAPRNMFVVVSARYCEDSACERVTLRIWSGDTFIMDRLGPHQERIRIANIDAADVIASCATEATVAQDAKLQLMAILANSSIVLARVSVSERVSMAFVTANGRDVGKSMMDRRYARPFEQPARSWCRFCVHRGSIRNRGTQQPQITIFP